MIGFRRFHRFNKSSYRRLRLSMSWGPWWLELGLLTHTDPTNSEYLIHPTTPVRIRVWLPVWELLWQLLQPTNYENDDEGAVRNCSREYSSFLERHDTAAVGRSSLKTADYVNIAGLHWKGVQQIVQRHAETVSEQIKDRRSDSYGAEVRFSTPDVALVHATWDVTGLESSHWRGRSSSERNHHDDDGQN